MGCISDHLSQTPDVAALFAAIRSVADRDASGPWKDRGASAVQADTGLFVALDDHTVLVVYGAGAINESACDHAYQIEHPWRTS
jgi:hypothetical protein